MATEGLATKALFGMTGAELRALVVGMGLPGYRGTQLADGLYRQRVASVAEITVLPVGVRDGLSAAGFEVGLPVLAQTAKSVDGTERYLVQLADGETVETVWMPGGDGGERGDGSAAAEEEAGEADGIGGAGMGVASETRSAHVSETRHGAPGFVAGMGEHPNLSGETGKDGAPGFVAGMGEHPTVSGETGKDGAPGASPMPWGERKNVGYQRATICVSSQVGCAVNCQFCLTAKLGIKRNLTAGEIAGQVAAVLNRHGVELRTGTSPDRINLVFMGMGEPFLNYDSFMDAVRLLVEMGIPASRMTVSTSGIEPGIRRFAAETVRPKLALSLNASNDVVRESIMPITRKWNIEALLDAVKAIPMGKREYVTFEYVLLGGVNDQPEHAAEVLKLLKGMNAKVNLIVWNPGPGIQYQQPSQESADRFHKLLIAGGVPAFTRRPRGRDIYAACGQLKRTVEGDLKENGPGIVSLVTIKG